MHKLLRFLKDNSGVTAIEYGLIAAGIAVVIIVGKTAAPSPKGDRPFELAGVEIVSTRRGINTGTAPMPG